MKNLTQNESANLTQKIWDKLISEAPKSTALVRQIRPRKYISQSIEVLFSYEHLGLIHDNHYNWLLSTLSDEDVLLAVDTLAGVVHVSSGKIERDRGAMMKNPIGGGG